MDEESISSYDFKPINDKCSTNNQTVIENNNNNNSKINLINEQAKIDSQYDSINDVKAMYGGNIYGLKNYEIIFNKKKININTFSINEALNHLTNTFKIKKDCLFEVNELNNKKKITSIYHLKNNKRKIYKKIR